MAFDERSIGILDQLRRYLASITDEHTRTTVAAWVRAWDDVAPELVAALADLAAEAGDGRLTRSQILKSRRLTNALDTIETRLAGLVEGSATTVIGQLRQVVDHAGRTTDQLVGSQLPADVATATPWARVDPRQVDAIIERTTEQITKVSFPLSGEATATIKRNLVRGLLTGSNPREVARRAVRQAEQGFNGGMTRALTIARTEMLDAYRSAQQLAEKAHTDVLESWIWACTLGERTCPACWSMHGSEHPIDEPGPIDHQNGRCARLPKTKSWRELGFNIEEPPSLIPDAATAFDALTTSQKINILGPAKYKAWTAGKFPMKSWATLRHTPAWRDSFVPAPAPKAFKGARRDKLQPPGPQPWRWLKGAKAKLGKQPARVLDDIAKLHAVPTPSTLTVGVESTGHYRGAYYPGSNVLRINPNGDQKSLTTAHEFGHYLDLKDFGQGVRFASMSDTSDEWNALRQAFDRSPEIQNLRAELLRLSTATSAFEKQLAQNVEYLLGRDETFARAYAQWVAGKVDNPRLTAQLASVANESHHQPLRHWKPENFTEIAQALDVIFGSRLRP